MRPIVDARVDDAPLHNSARDRFVFNNGGTTTTPSTSYQNHIDDDVAPKKPFGLVRGFCGGGDVGGNAQSEREMVFPANPLLSNVSMTPTPRQNHHHHQAALKCLDANAILMATVVSATKRSRPMPTKKTSKSNVMMRDDFDEGEETPLVRETFTPEMSSSSSSNTRDGPRNNRSKTTTTTIPTSPVLSLLRTMFASWNYPNNDILSPSADMSKFECGRTPKSSPADLINDDDVKTHETTFANAVFISEASKRLQKMCNDQRTRALLDASANGISPGSSRILIDKYNCFTDSSDEEVESVDSSPEKEEVKQEEEEKQEVPVVAPVVAEEEEEEEKEEEEDAVEYSVPPPVTPTSITMPTRALFSSPGKASLTDDDDDFENEEKLEMTMDEGEYYTFFFSKTAIRVTAERYIRAAKRCSGDKVARENFCYKLWHHEAFSELFLSATLTAMCKLSLRMKSAFWNDTKNDSIVGAVVSSIKIENAYFTNYYANQIGKYLGTAMTIASPSSTPPSQSSSSSSLHVMNNYDDKFIYSCVAYAIAYVFVHCLFFLFHRGARDADAQYCYWKKKVSLIRWKATHAFTPVKRFVEKKKARWCLVYGRVKEEDVDPSARAKTEFCDLVAKTP